MRYFYFGIVFIMLLLTPGEAMSHAAILQDSLPEDIAGKEFLPTRYERLDQYKAGDNIYWFRYHLRPEEKNTDLILTISNTNFRAVCFYEDVNGGLRLIGRSGNRYKEETGSFYRYNQLEVRTQASYIYFKADVALYSMIEFSVLPEPVFSSRERLNFLGLGIYYGIVLMAVVFNLIFFIVFKDRRFLTYTLLLSGISLMFLYEDGIVGALIFNTWLLDNYMMITALLNVVFACMFTYHFLELKYRYPEFVWHSVIVLSVAALCLAIYLIYPGDMMSHILHSSNFLVVALCCWAAIRLFRVNVLARFLIITLGIVLLFGVAYNLHQYGVFQGDHFGRSTFKLVSLFEIMTISFAIIYEVKRVMLQNSFYKREINRYVKELSDQEKMFLQQQSQHGIPDIDGIREEFQLTERETEVLMYILEGKTNREIADKLYVSVSTVKFHTGNLYTKLDIKNRTEVLQFVNG
ncbi:7TM diverse intracellular signaling domain-containing protein [Sinomicrobium oceani]|uniref:7TM diverse intracellular signaling domain-containing protein n=1 Tax=Sinomicrobium oceani TaxID=1150368 RepID=UPI00227C375D|nr:7TM diverse intracellular signaling domain-containing protein [Sinomicrobium oceani]